MLQARYAKWQCCSAEEQYELFLGYRLSQRGRRRPSADMPSKEAQPSIPDNLNTICLLVREGGEIMGQRSLIDESSFE